MQGSLSTHNADGNGDIKEAIGLITKRTTLHVHHAFLYISRCSITTWNVPMGHIVEDVNNDFFVLFLHFDVLPKNSTSENLTLIWPITCKPVETATRN